MANGFLTHRFVRAEEFRFGLMVLCTKATGWITRQTVKVVSSTQMAMFMMDHGRMTKRMDSVFTATWTEPATRASGRKISSMGTVLRPGLMVPAIRDNTWRVASTVKDASLGLITAHTLETSSRTT